MDREYTETVPFLHIGVFICSMTQQQLRYTLVPILLCI